MTENANTHPSDTKKEEGFDSESLKDILSILDDMQQKMVTQETLNKSLENKLDRIELRLAGLERFSTEVKNGFAELETKFDSFKTEIRDRTRVVREMEITRQQAWPFHRHVDYPKENFVPDGLRLIDTQEDFIPERRYRR